MDPYEPIYGLDESSVWGAVNSRNNPIWDPVRRNLAYSAVLARTIDLARAMPSDRLCSSGFCLADPPDSYVAYFPEPGGGTIDLSGVDSALDAEWYDPNTRETRAGGSVQGGAPCTEVCPPFPADAVLRLSRAR
jgi:hypothetical protein